MSRGSRFEDEEVELNLAPIMNLVMILIPLLLLSVVFEQMGVINVSAPKLAVGPENPDTTPPEKPPLQLTVAISFTGFTIAGEGSVLGPISGCPEGGATVCVKSGTNVQAKLSEVRDLRARFDAAPSKANRAFINESDAKLQEAIAMYDWRQLYNMLVDIKKKFPDETVVNVAADATIPFEIVVKAMDVVRFKLEGGTDGRFESDKDFQLATYKESGAGDSVYAILFSDVVLAVAQ